MSTTDRMSLSELTRRYHNGTPIGILAELNGCRVETVRKALNGGGWVQHTSLLGDPKEEPEPVAQIKAPQVLKRRKTEEKNMGKGSALDKSEWMEWHSQGLTPSQMAERAGCSITPVRIWHKENGLENNKTSKPVKHKSLNGDPRTNTVGDAVKKIKNELGVVSPGKQHLEDMEQQPKREIKTTFVSEGEPVAEANESDTITTEITPEPELIEALEKIGVDTREPVLFDITIHATQKPPTRTDWQRYRRAQLAEWIQHCAGKGLAIEPEFVQEWNEGVG